MPAAAPSRLFSYQEAASLLRSHAQRAALAPRSSELVVLSAASGRVLAETVVADRDQPPFPRSTRDGFACRAEDLALGPVAVVGLLRAGEPWRGGELLPGQALEIMTGAAVPPGADCVVMLEHVTTTDGHIRLSEPRSLAPGDNIVPAGAEARAGSGVLPAGIRLGPPQIAAAAACGRATLAVFPRPRVAILATGDELVDPASTPQQHQIRNSNSYSLAVQVVAAGGDPAIFPIVRDDAGLTEEAIAQASHFDLILLTGGVSMGKFDFVEQALQSAGAEFHFTGARIQPGKPIVFGRLRGPYFFGLPGNPISTMVTCALFAAPLLRALGGELDPEPQFGLARLEEEVRIQPGLTRFLPARMETGVHGARIRRIPWQGSGDLAAAARSNAFLVVPETVDRLAAGEIVSVLLL
jgi:molybdopterin molybdotransferase